MLGRLLIAAGIVVVAVVVALVLRRRGRPADAPTQPRGHVPQQLDRGEFARPDAPWLVVAFSSAQCAACTDVATKVLALQSEDVAVHDVEYPARRDLHDKYAIDSVPCVVMADTAGVVRWSVLGPVSAADLWAEVAAVRAGGAQEAS